MSPGTIHAVELPKQTRKLTYDYTASLDAVKELLEAGQTPGDGPFDTQGKARAAANSLLAQLGDDGKQYGARVVQKDDGFHFGLKKGRKEYKGRTTAEKTPAAKGAKKS